MTRRYELLFIVDPTLADAKRDAAIGEVRDLISQLGGDVFSEDVWGKRLFAYDIERHKEGVYVLFYVNLPTNQFAEMSESLKLNKLVLRHLLTTMDDKDEVMNVTTDMLSRTFIPRPGMRLEQKAKEAEEKEAKKSDSKKKFEGKKSIREQKEEEKAAKEAAKEAKKAEAAKEDSKKPAKKKAEDIDSVLDNIINDADLKL